MTGYDGFAKSNGAIEAESRGLHPASWWARRIRRGVKAGHIAAIMGPAEWHHTSAHYNETNYYKCPALSELRAIVALAREPVTSQSWTGCTIQYPVWSGGRAHRSAVTREFRGCLVTRKGRLYTISCDGETIRKRSGTCGLRIYDAQGERIE